MPIKYTSLHPDLQALIDRGAYGGALEGRGASIPPFYVDKNVRASGDGLSWDEAYKTIPEAVTASNSYMASANYRAWAKRATIYVCGDGESESVTAIPEKCDLIGVGSDISPFPKLTGTWTVVSTAQNTAFRMFNIGIIGDTAAACLTMPTGCHGFKIIGCSLYFTTGTANTHGIEFTNCAEVEIAGCDFFPAANSITFGSYWNVFATAGIEINGVGAWRTKIHNNFITGAKGVFINSDVVSAGGARINDNVIAATGLTIDDDSNLFFDYRNTEFSAEAKGATRDVIGTMSCDNVVRANDGARLEPSTDQEY